MTKDLLDSFVLDAWDALTRLQTASAAYSYSERARADAQLFTHRLRGTAALYGYPGVAGIAQLTEGLLERSPRLPEDQLPRVEEFLKAATAVMYDALLRVAKGQNEGNLGLELGRVEASELLHDLLGRVPAAFVRQEILEQLEEPEDESLAQYLPRFRDTHDEIWSFFAPEAAEHVEAIYTALEAKGEEAETLTQLFRATHTLKGAAYMVNFRPMGELAHALEDLMMLVRDGGKAFDHRAKHALKSGANALDAMLRSAEGEANAVDKIVADLAGELSQVLERDIELGAAPEDDSEADEMAAELAAFVSEDAETWEYFGPEIQENIDLFVTSLEKLESDPDGDHDDALADMRRAAHTLKGSSLMVGFPHMSEPAKRLEFLATAVREDLELKQDVLESMREGSEVLKGMFGAAEGRVSRIAKRTNALVAQLDKLLESGAEEEAEIAVPERSAQATVRVGVDKLDALMNLAGELVSSRARMGALLEQFNTLSHDFAASRIRMGRTVEDFSERHLNPRFQGDAGASEEGAKGFNLGERFDELEFDTYSDLNILSRSVTEMANDLSSVQTSIDTLAEGLEVELEGVRKLTRELRASASRARMISIGTLFSRLGRLLSDPGEGKRFRLEVEGETVEVDNAILEAISDPLLHLVKNSLFHGLESAATRHALGKDEEGVIRLNASLKGNQVVVSVEDDGRGIDIEAVKAKATERRVISPEVADNLSRAEALDLIFAPGLSTAKTVTQDAGRGVGMDAVREGIRAVRGEVEVETTAGKGSRFTLRLPLTLLVSDILVANVGTHRLAFSASNVKGLRAMTEADLGDNNFGDNDGERYALFEGVKADFVDLRELFGSPNSARAFTVVFMQSAGELLAFATDEVANIEEVMVRGLNGMLARLDYLAGATVDSQGRVIPIYEPQGLARLAKSGKRVSVAATQESSARQHLLVVDDSLSVRKVLSTMLRRAGFDISTAVDGQDALDKCRAESYDAVLTDLEMPRLNGYELIEELRRKDDAEHLPIIVMTTRAASKHMNLAYELGADNYLTKPVDESKLLSAIRQAFREERGALT